MRILQRAFAFAFLVFTSTAALAEGGLIASSGNDRCGLGTMIWGKSGNSISTQSSENSSNVLTLNEMFSVTTGTSGCKNSGIVRVPNKELHYIYANYHELQMDMARGEGETFRGLAEAMECPVEQMDLVMVTGKNAFSEIYADETPNAFMVTKNVREALSRNPKLKRACRSLAAI